MRKVRVVWIKWTNRVTLRNSSATGSSDGFGPIIFQIPATRVSEL